MSTTPSGEQLVELRRERSLRRPYSTSAATSGIDRPSRTSLTERRAAVGEQDPAALGLGGDRDQHAIGDGPGEQRVQRDLERGSRPAAFNQIGPSIVGTRSTVAHGCSVTCSTAPVRRVPATASRASTHTTADVRHDVVDQAAMPSSISDRIASRDRPSRRYSSLVRALSLTGGLCTASRAGLVGLGSRLGVASRGAITAMARSVR